MDLSNNGWDGLVEEKERVRCRRVEESNDPTLGVRVAVFVGTNTVGAYSVFPRMKTA